jgi:hypothetical protein
MRSEAIEATGPNGLLRVEFVLRGDRYAHVISLVKSNGEIQPLLESVEGTAADDWPSSPPLQSISVETLSDGRPAALLVGMAGGSHWSASVEPIQGEPELMFDVACRHSRPPTWLGSRYRRLSSAAQRVTIRCDQANVTYDDEFIVIKSSAAASTGTARWKYAFHLNPEP